MSDKALYSKYRPRTIQDIIGQDHIKRYFEGAVNKNRISHAYLLSGPRGTGKTSLSRIISLIVNCENGPSLNYDINSKICDSIISGKCPDIHEIDAASNTSIDDVRDIRSMAKNSPIMCKKRVFIIDECLPKEAQIRVEGFQTKSIIDIVNSKEDQYVYSYNFEKKETEIKKVIRKIIIPNNKVMKSITIKYGNKETILRITDNHKVFLSNGEEKKVSELKIDDKLILMWNVLPLPIHGIIPKVKILENKVLDINEENITFYSKDKNEILKTKRNNSFYYIIKKENTIFDENYFIDNENFVKEENLKIGDITLGHERLPYMFDGKILKIEEEKCEDDYVYNLEVKDNHNYFADNILVSNCHSWRGAAASALLKVLEEPPQSTIFILATTESNKILPTIKSRCQCFNFSQLKISEISSHLINLCQKENIKIDKQSALIIAKSAQGSMRDAISILDAAMSRSEGDINDSVIKDIIGYESIDFCINLLKNILLKNYSECMKIIKTKQIEGKETKYLFDSFLDYVYDIMMAKSFNNYSFLYLDKEIEKSWLEVYEMVDLKIITFIIKKLRESISTLNNMPKQEIALAACIIEIIQMLSK